MAEVAAAGEVQRFPKSDLEALVTGQFKEFLKLKCAECGKPATKRYSKSMSFVVSKMLESFWCPECGRVLCEAHRDQHTCERLDQQKERNKHLTHEQLASQLAEAEARKESLEEEKRLAAAVIAEAAEKERLQRKGKREILAKKARAVEGLLQAVLRDTDMMQRRPASARTELEEMYGKAKRISLTLFNEFQHPTLPGLADEDWEEIKAIYQRVRDLTGMMAMMEEGPLDMRNPWDPPPPPSEEDAIARDGAGLGRGLL
eukprot:CAMPEP_0178459782 /NCGR_PEP_ID=MMETSP0689_2-20121128/48327_1 /TAXON_ID=160604 /ORGANISM="Amphidinium massartii, Strain CS-259" /LENGTH=258 /DNA_ID=CAMNT_0020086309 /DNA_START=76 /DNA_END=852 /DNA_ORIENTATION=-